MNASKILGLLIAGSLLAGCGDPEVVTCAEGTFDGTQCVVTNCPEGFTADGAGCVPDEPDPFDTEGPVTSVTPDGGAFPGQVVATVGSDEPATIYYTTDGSTPSTSSESGAAPLEITLTAAGTLSFFGVDVSGNEGDVGTADFEVDPDAPGLVSNFAATLNGQVVDLTWSNPSDADFDSVLIVRSVGAAAPYTPELGRTYQAGEILGPNLEVAYVGSAEAVADVGAHGGTNHYEAFARDALGNFSAAAAAMATDVPIVPGQVATLEVHLASNEVVVTNQPKDFHLLPKSFEDGAGELNVELEAQSLVGGEAWNVKAVATSVVGGTAVSGMDVGADPAFSFGRHIAEGASGTTNLRITGVGGTDPVVITLGMRADPVLVTAGRSFSPVGYSLIDAGSGDAEALGCITPMPLTGGFGQRCDYYVSAKVPGETRVLFGSRYTAHVVSVDVVTGQETTSANLAIGGNQIGMVGGLAVSPDGNTVYALVTTGAHPRAASNSQAQWAFSTATVEFVVLNAADLSVAGRTTVRTNNAEQIMGRGLSIDAAGDFAGFVTWGQVERRVYRYHIVNNTFTFANVPGTDRLNDTAISPNGAVVFVARRNEGFLSRYIPPVVSNVALPAGNDSPRTRRIDFAPDARLIHPQRSDDGIFAFTPGAGTPFELISNRTVRTAAFNDAGTRLYATTQNGELLVLDLLTNAEISLERIEPDAFGFPSAGHLVGEVFGN